MHLTHLTRFHILALAAALALAGCGRFSIPEPVGDLEIVFEDFSAKSILPSVDMTIDGYRVSGIGPDGRSFQVSSWESPVTIIGLTIGDWQITVDGMNVEGLIIGRGTATARIHTTATTTTSVLISPLYGQGSLRVSLSWPVAEIESPTVSAELTPTGGAPTSLPFNVGTDGTAEYLGTASAGYYTLTIRLEDTGVTVAGATETIRILSGHETTGTFSFTEINSPGGSVEIEITWDMNDPITVVLSNVPVQITTSQSVTLSASAPAETDPVSFTWYLNGSAAGTGPTLTVAGSLGIGYYRVDAVAVNTDGSRSGSTSATFTIINP